MEEQKINKKITISIVAVLLIVLITIGATYAYFSAQAETGTQTVTTGTLTMGFDKAGSVVTINGITPINDNEIETKAAAFPFSITNTGTEHMKLTIKLKDIVIADDLKDVDFRWGLYNPDKQDAAGTEMGVSFGIFKYAETGGEEIILRDVILDSGSAAKNYILRIWIHDDGDNQNYMQGETFSAKIDITGEAVEYTPESCFTFDESTGTITAYDAATCGPDLVIPKTINETTVTSLGKRTGEGDRTYYLSGSGAEVKLTSVIIPDTVTKIKNSFNYNSLTHVTIPESVTEIEESFSNNNITSVFIPESVTTYDLYDNLTFAGNPIKVFVMPSSFVEGSIMMAENIIIMEGITKLDTIRVNSATSIEIPSSVTTINGKILWVVGTPQPVTEIVVRGKTEEEATATFAKDWNCLTLDAFQEGTPCTLYANVVYRP